MSALRLLVTAVSCGLLCFSCGCGEDDSYSDHTPPDGKGSLVVDNQTSDRVRVYLDDIYRDRAPDWDVLILDLDPGLYRVFLDSKDSDRTYQNDVDVLEGRLTILHVTPDPSSATAYIVRIEYGE